MSHQVVLFLEVMPPASMWGESGEHECWALLNQSRSLLWQEGASLGSSGARHASKLIYFLTRDCRRKVITFGNYLLVSETPDKDMISLNMNQEM